MGTDLVNPEGPEGKPDPVAAAIDIRETFGRMAMNDIETAAPSSAAIRPAKNGHGNGNPDWDPNWRPAEQLGLGWANHNKGTGVATTRSPAARGHLTHTPTKWDNSYLEILYGNEWSDQDSRRAHQWKPKNDGWANCTDGAGRRQDPPVDADHGPVDRFDPTTRKITRRWLIIRRNSLRNSRAAGFACPPRHGSGDPLSRPAGAQADFGVAGRRSGRQDAFRRRGRKFATAIAESDRPAQLVQPQGAAIVLPSGKGMMRGGANGGRIRLQPQLGWELNEPDELAHVIRTLRGFRPPPGSAHPSRHVAGRQCRCGEGGQGSRFDIEVPFSSRPR